VASRIGRPLALVLAYTTQALGVAALAEGADGFGPALVAASMVVAFGGVLMFVVWVYEAQTEASSS
jgi:hypothetical protein